MFIESLKEKYGGKLWKLFLQLVFIPYYLDHNKANLDKRIAKYNSFFYHHLMSKETQRYFNGFGYYG